MPGYTCDDRGYINFVDGLIIGDRYKMIAQIGKGTFSRVMKCEDLKPEDKANRLVALKINRNVNNYQAAAKIEYEILKTIKEIDNLDKSNCAHILTSFEYYAHKCFVFPLFGRSVYGFLSANNYAPFATPHVKQFAWQIIGAVKFMHDCKIIFTDLKPENIVFVENRTTRRAVSTSLTVEIPLDTRLKVIDFGSALFADHWHTHLVQTRHYRAPEVVLGMEWSFPIDIWSIGCIMLEFIYGKMVFNTHDSIDHLNQMTRMIGTMPEPWRKRIPRKVYNAAFDKETGALKLERAKISDVQCHLLQAYFGPDDDDMYDLVSRMLRWSPEERISTEDALRHPYFADVDTTGLSPNKSLWQSENLMTEHDGVTSLSASPRNVNPYVQL